MKKYVFIGIAFFLASVMLFDVSSLSDFGSSISKYGDMVNSLFENIVSATKSQDVEFDEEEINSAINGTIDQTPQVIYVLDYYGTKYTLECKWKFELNYNANGDSNSLVIKSDCPYVPPGTVISKAVFGISVPFNLPEGKKDVYFIRWNYDMTVILPENVGE